MTIEEVKAPKLRFPGFTDAWEQRKLGDVFNEYSEKKHPELPALTIIQGTGTILRDESDRKLQYDKASLVNYKLVNKDDLIVHLRSFEGGLEKANSEGIVSPAYHIFHGENTDTRFYYPFFRSRRFIDVLLKPHVYGIRDGKSIDIEGMKTISIPVPSYEEQEKVGDFIEKLDNLITLHQRKLDTLKKLKKGFLQKMFPKNGESVPEIRFSSFTDAWEQRKLGDLAEIVGGGTPSTSKDEYWDGEIDWYAPAEIANQIYVESSERKITSEGLNNSSAKMLPVGTVLFTSRAGIGKMAILRKEACTNQGFQSIVPHVNELDSYFIFSRSEELKRYGETVGAGSTFVEVSGKQMSAMPLMMPPTIDEQRKIGEYFSSLDNLITLHQRKLDTLKKLKKGFLQKMFPKNGESVPEIRFSSFTDAWEQRKLKELGELTSSKRIHVSDYVDNGIPFYRGKEITELKENKTISEPLYISENSYQELSNKYGVPKIGELLITAVGTIGNTWVIDKTPFYFKDGNLIWFKKIKCDANYLDCVLSSPIGQKLIDDSASGSNQKALTIVKLNEIEIKLPALDEQKKISLFFSMINNLITLHQRKLDTLKKLKKGFLQKMFPKHVNLKY